MIEKIWDWEKMNNKHWQEPADEVYYYLYKWSTKSSKKILDLGSGAGRHSVLFAKNDFDVTAFDISENGLEILHKKAQDFNLNIKAIKGNMTRLPFGSQTFDFILAYNSIYHTDYEGVIRTVYEMKRILKDNGEAFITMLSKDDASYKENFDNLISENTFRKKEEDGSYWPHFFVDYKKVRELFKCFEIVSIKQVEHYDDTRSFLHYNIHIRKEAAEYESSKMASMF